MKRSWTWTMVVMAALVLAAAGARAQTVYTWSGPSNGDWFAGANWTPTGIPGTNAGDSATVTNGAILLTNSPGALASFAITNATLTFSNWTTRLQATTVTVSGGTLTLPSAFTNNAMSNRVWVACSNFTLVAPGTIDVDKKGFLGSHGPGGASTTTRWGGGGHGGRGGAGDVDPRPGNTNGAVHAPLNPGSGGCGNIAAGGAGGGAVLIEATGTVDLRGVITANGQGADGLGASGGGGSGGSIYIVCNAFDGTSGARLSARGGRNGSNVAQGGGGGGGRIAVAYTTCNPGAASVRFTTAPGAGASDYFAASRGWFYRADWGTLSMPDATLLTGTPATQQFDKVNLYFRDLTAWTVANLTVISNAFVLATPGLAVTVGGDLTVGTSGQFGIGEPFGASNSVLTVGNRLVVTNGGLLEVYAGLASAALGGAGASVVVSNTLAVATNSWINPYSHGTNGGSARFRATNVTVAAGGGFNALARGYQGGQGPGAGTRSGQRGTGGGHGGRGGASDIHVGGGVTNGSAAWPGPGSGGADISGYPSIYGGGLVYIEGASVTLDGTINANGASGAYGNYGGGAGGGILIACDTLTGQAPLLAVNGGNRDSTGGGGGGGGRMALHYNSIALQTPRFQASPGIGQHSGLESSSWQLVAGEGTLWCSDSNLLATTLDGGRFSNICFLASTFNAWTVPSLTISNSSIRFGEDGFALTVAGGLTIGTNGALGIGALSGNARPALTCGGDLRVRNGGALHVYAGKTNAAGIGASVDVTGDLTVETNAWVYPYTHEYYAVGGGAPRFKARSLTVAAGGGFKAIGRGYRMQQGPNQGTQTSSRSGGGGYGGRGGDHALTVGSGGGTNGMPLAPILPGSGSCREDSGSGGGVIWIELAGTASVDGLLAANGASGYYGHSGGGAGGSVLVRANGVRAGTGSVWRALGGNGISDGGGGGGGRIAVWKRMSDQDAGALFAGQAPTRLQDKIATNAVMFSQFQASVSVAGGTTTGAGKPGEAGTIRFIDARPAGTIIIIQ